MRIIIGLMLGFFCTSAFAQGSDFNTNQDTVVDQAYRGVTQTYNDTTKFKVTRGFYNGNATACDVGVIFNGAATTVITLKNVPSGATMPYQIIALRSSETTCSAGVIVLLY